MIFAVDNLDKMGIFKKNILEFYELHWFKTKVSTLD